MADFTPAFADNGERREPSTDEQDGGFLCGPADLPLFNWLMWAPQKEIAAVIAAAGITGSNGDMTQLLQAIQALISAATGGSPTSDYLLVTQARARLPIFPDVQTADGKINVTTTGNNNVRIPSGVTFQHRGIFPITTAQLDIPVDSSKTYHIRWNPTDGFTAKDVANAVYNPTAVVETDPRFDSVYDDMLVARAIVNSSGAVQLTPLVNKDRLRENRAITGVAQANSNQNGARFGFSDSWNWARTPITRALTDVRAVGDDPGDNDLNLYSSYPTAVTQVPVTRYGTSFAQLRDGRSGVIVAIDIGA